MAVTVFQDIKGSLRQVYLEDEWPWLVGFSGGKDGTITAPMASPTTCSTSSQVTLLADIIPTWHCAKRDSL